MTKKQILLEKLSESHGIIKPACAAANVSRQTFYNYCERDPKFKKAYENILEEQIDYVESRLLDSVSAGEVSAQIFFLKCKGKHRGYIEKIENEHTGSLSININRNVINDNGAHSGD